MWALVAVGICTLFANVSTALYAHKAFTTAHETLRLGSDPVLIVTEVISMLSIGTTLPERLTLQKEFHYVISGDPELMNGIGLYLWNQADEHTIPSNAMGMGYANERHTITLEVHNVGKYAALAVEIDLEMSVPFHSKKPIKKFPGLQLNAETETDSHYSGTLHSIGTIRLPAIPSQEKISIRIDNNLGLQVTLTPQTEGRCTLGPKQERGFLWWRKRIHSIIRVPVVVPGESFRIT